jgi:hypothetical protein
MDDALLSMFNQRTSYKLTYDSSEFNVDDYGSPIQRMESSIAYDADPTKGTAVVYEFGANEATYSDTMWDLFSAN